MVELLDLGPLWFAQSLENGDRVGDRVSNDLAYTLMRLVGYQRRTAIGDKLVRVEHSQVLMLRLLSPLSDRPKHFPVIELLNLPVALINKLRAYLQLIFLMW